MPCSPSPHPPLPPLSPEPPPHLPPPPAPSLQAALALPAFVRGHLLMQLQQAAVEKGVQGSSREAQDLVRPLQLLLDRPRVPLRDLLAAACSQASRRGMWVGGWAGGGGGAGRGLRKGLWVLRLSAVQSALRPV